MPEIDNCLDHIEWEGLQKPWKIDQINLSKHIFQGSNLIEISRDDSYNVIAKISGTSNDNDKEKINGDRIAGKFIPTFQITGSSYGGVVTYELNGCVISEYSYNTHNGQTKIIAPIIISEVKKKFKNDNKVSWLTEWYLNGSHDISYFPRVTERKKFLNFQKQRISIDKDKKKFNGGRSSSGGRDFAFIDVGKFQLIISQVPKGLGPSWSNSIGIEYRNEFGGIPDSNVRETISEIVSFIIGRQLLNIGYSIFTDEGNPIEHVSFSPWGSNVVHLCQKSGNPPIEFKTVDAKRFELILSEFAQNYLKLRDELNLRDVLWQYWISNNNPIGTNLPIMSSALETLAKSWFKSKKSKIKGVYIPKKDFDSLLESDFSKIEKKLKSVSYGEKIYDRIRNTFQMGANERLQFFFDEIALSIGEIEGRAIGSRNKMAHGHSMTADKEKHEMIFMTDAYQTLIHRILLKILDYKGSYIDRSSIGFPERKIDEPMHGEQ